MQGGGNSQNNPGKEHSWRTHTFQFQNIPQSYNNEIEKPLHSGSAEFQQVCQDNSIREKQSSTNGCCNTEYSHAKERS